MSVRSRLEQLEHNLTNHPPRDANVARRFETLRHYAKQFGEEIVTQCPESREQSLALTNLEQALMWAVAAVARNQGQIPEVTA